ncbi:protein of unknown function [Shewanella benthica]|uniref:Uncharacterized protein n=1 Tax=Shewanella benthica TaxID=43661 RepID=A0A330LYX6_9GAMM|nr:protein of unknown function [Shewanella benthica]
MYIQVGQMLPDLCSIATEFISIPSLQFIHWSLRMLYRQANYFIGSNAQFFCW